MEPSDEQWRTLYRTMAQFDDMAPWEWMSDADIVGVEDPDSGMVCYCCVMGMGGELYALGAYRGTPGIDSYFKLLNGSPNRIAGLVASQDCLMASFNDRQDLTDIDRNVIKRLGLKFRGSLAWPLFRSYIPAYKPWYIDSEEARLLVICLEQTMDVASRLLENPRLLPRLSPKGDFLVRAYEEGKWKDTRRKPAALPGIKDAPAPFDRDRAAVMAKELPRTGVVIEVLVELLPTPIVGEGRPYLPYIAAAGDHRFGAILGMEIAKPGQQGEAVGRVVLDAVTSVNAIPAEILVPDKSLALQVEPLAKALGTRVRTSPKLAIREAIKELEGFLDHRSMA